MDSSSELDQTSSVNSLPEGAHQAPDFGIDEHLILPEQLQRITGVEENLQDLDEFLRSVQSDTDTGCETSRESLVADRNFLDLNIASQHFVTLEHFQEVTGRLFKEILAVKTDVEKKLEDSEILCQVQNELKYIDLKQADVMDFCHDNDGQIDALNKECKAISKKLACMKCDLDSVIQETRRVDHELDVVREELNAIKCVKANQETVDSIAEGKADKTAVAKKVSHTTFEPIRKHLTNDLNTVRDKVDHQETVLLQKTMQLSIQVTRERESFEEKLKKIHDKITNDFKRLEGEVKAIRSERAAVKAAGCISGCLSCGERTTMEPTEPCVPLTKPFKQELNRTRFESLRYVDELEVIDSENLEIQNLTLKMTNNELS